MNEQTTKLLEQLASKLGTTTQYLWSILIKQAPIDAIITLIQGVVIVLLGYGLYKIHKKLMQKPADDYHDNMYDKYEVIAAMPMIIALVFWLTIVVMWVCCIGDIVNGFFNPEYWALHKVFTLIGN